MEDLTSTLIFVHFVLSPMPSSASAASSSSSRILILLLSLSVSLLLLDETFEEGEYVESTAPVTSSLYNRSKELILSCLMLLLLPLLALLVVSSTIESR